MSKDKIVAVCDSTVSIQAAAGDEPKGPATFDVTAYNGGALVVGGHELPVVVDLSTLKRARSIKANLDHESGKRVGHVTDMVKGERDLRLSGRMSASTDHRREVVESAKDGFEWEASIEASRGNGTLETIRKGKSVEVNGQTFNGPLYVARGYTLTAFAFLSHGADPETTVAIAAGAASQRESTMDPKFKDWLEARDWNPDEISAKQLETLQAAFDADNGKSKKTSKPGTAEEVLAAAKRERERVEAITSLTQAALVDYPNQIEVIEAMCRLAIDNNSSPQEYELELLRAGRSSGTLVTRPISTRNGGNLTDKVLQAAVCLAGRLDGLESKPEKYGFDERTLETAHKEFPNGIGLKQMLLLGARANGYTGNLSTEVTVDAQRHAFGMGNGNGRIHASGFSTLSIPLILANTANKFLREGWMAVDQTWRSIASVISVPDFKTRSTYSLTGAFQFEAVGPGGELKHATVGEESYSNKADTYGIMFAITRTDIINDDLGALTAVPRRIGRGAGLTLNNIFWTEFLNNSSFFHTNYNNVSTGGGSALGLAGLQAAEQKFLDQTDPNGKPLGIMPSILLVPTALKATAMNLMSSQLLIDGTSTAAQGSNNIWTGRFAVHSSPYMSNSSYTGYSTAAWYLLAAPSEGSVIEVCFLNGKDMPTVDSADADFNTLGIQMRGYIDAGVNLQEPRFGVRSAGS